MRNLIQNLSPDAFVGRSVESEQILEWFDLCDAYWEHNGDPAMPHAELTTGMCSNGFFDCPRVLEYGNVCEIFARQLYQRLIRDEDVGRVDRVIGSAYSAITFSYELSKQFGARHGYVQKDQADPTGKRMVWKGSPIAPDERVLQAEELITTRKTALNVRQAVICAHNGVSPVFLPVVATIVHRPPELPVDYGEFRVVALVEKAIWAVAPPCSLCKQGSNRLRPRGEAGNWDKLKGRT